jgi:hypothetical protein
VHPTHNPDKTDQTHLTQPNPFIHKFGFVYYRNPNFYKNPSSVIYKPKFRIPIANKLHQTEEKKEETKSIFVAMGFSAMG